MHPNQPVTLSQWFVLVLTTCKIQMQRGYLRLRRFFHTRYTKHVSSAPELTFRRILLEAFFPNIVGHKSSRSESAYQRTRNDPKRYSTWIVPDPRFTLAQQLAAIMPAPARRRKYSHTQYRPSTRPQSHCAAPFRPTVAIKHSESIHKSNAALLATTSVSRYSTTQPTRAKTYAPLSYQPNRKATPAEEREWRIAAFIGTVGLVFLILLFISFPNKPPLLRVTHAEESHNHRQSGLLSDLPPRRNVSENLLPADTETIFEPAEPVILPEPELSLNMDRTYLPSDIVEQYTPDDDTPFEISSLDNPVSPARRTGSSYLDSQRQFDDWVLHDPTRVTPRTRLDQNQNWSDQFDTEYTSDRKVENLSRPTVYSKVQNGEVMLAVEKSTPDRAAVNEQLQYEIVIRNTGQQTLDQLVVEESISSQHQFTSATPRATIPNRAGRSTDDNTIMWQLANMEPGAEQRLQVQLIATTEGPLETETRIQPVSSFSSQTEVESVRLAIKVELPESIELGELFPIRYSVTNQSEIPAEQVVLSCELPAGLEHKIGQDLQHDVGSLNPGQTHTALLYVTASKLGNVSHLASVGGDGAELVRKTKIVRVVKAPERKRSVPAKTGLATSAPSPCCCTPCWVRKVQP